MMPIGLDSTVPGNSLPELKAPSYVILESLFSAVPGCVRYQPSSRKYLYMAVDQESCQVLPFPFWPPLSPNREEMCRI
jgi:hypothetical protein